MIAVDASVVVAVLNDEQDTQAITERLLHASVALMPQSTALEAHMAAARVSKLMIERLDRLMVTLNISIVPLNATTHLAEARRAFDLYGKGRGHPAQLNFGDCLVYGFAKAEGLPLLFKGSDFIHTDITPA